MYSLSCIVLTKVASRRKTLSRTAGGTLDSRPPTSFVMSWIKPTSTMIPSMKLIPWKIHKHVKVDSNVYKTRQFKQYLGHFKMLCLPYPDSIIRLWIRTILSFVYLNEQFNLYTLSNDLTAWFVAYSLMKLRAIAGVHCNLKIWWHWGFLLGLLLELFGLRAFAVITYRFDYTEGVRWDYL